MAQEIISLPVGSSILQFQVRFSDRKVSRYDLEEELKATQDSLDQELINQPSKFAWVATLHAVALSYRDEIKQGLEMLSAELDREYRSKAATTQDKMTETSLRSQILVDSRYKQRYDDFLKACTDERVLKVAREAFEQRSQLLIAYAANKRAELNARVSVGAEEVRGIMGTGPGHRRRPS